MAYHIDMIIQLRVLTRAQMLSL